MMEDKSSLAKLKEDYSKIQEKYSLPSFEELNKEFQIEKIAESETDFLLREVRKYMAEKFSNYLRFVEAVLNPSNVSMFIFSFIKTLNPEDKKLLENAGKNLMKIEVESIELDIDSSEEKEVDFIKKSYILWEECKKEFLFIFQSVRKNWDNKTEANNKGYFG